MIRLLISHNHRVPTVILTIQLHFFSIPSYRAFSPRHIGSFKTHYDIEHLLQFEPLLNPKFVLDLGNINLKITLY